MALRLVTLSSNPGEKSGLPSQADHQKDPGGGDQQDQQRQRDERHDKDLEDLDQDVSRQTGRHCGIGA